MPFSLTASKTLAIVVLSLIHSMLWVKTSLIMLYGWLYLLLSSPFKHKGTKTEMIQRDAKQLQKIPLHLAIVISEPQIVYVDLAKMINWAFSLGVQFVSVYDMKGQYNIIMYMYCLLTFSKLGCDDFTCICTIVYSLIS